MDGVNPSSVLLRKNGPGSEQHYLRSANPPIHPGSMHAPMPQYFALQDQRRLEHVPRPQRFSPQYESIPAITFSVDGYPGVFMRNVWNGTVIVDGANDPVLESFKSSVIDLVWPGYDSNSVDSPMKSTLLRPVGRYITRQHLIKEICVKLYNFHENVSSIHRRHVAPGCEKWSLTDPRGIHGSHIILFSLHYYQGVWVPEFYVVTE